MSLAHTRCHECIHTLSHRCAHSATHAARGARSIGRPPQEDRPHRGSAGLYANQYGDSICRHHDFPVELTPALTRPLRPEQVRPEPGPSSAPLALGTVGNLPPPVPTPRCRGLCATSNDAGHGARSSAIQPNRRKSRRTAVVHADDAGGSASGSSRRLGRRSSRAPMLTSISAPA
jgi:hypothetical protein